jgi:hypothetical protein
MSFRRYNSCFKKDNKLLTTEDQASQNLIKNKALQKLQNRKENQRSKSVNLLKN